MSFAGSFTPELSAAMRESLHLVILPAKIWHDFMTAALTGAPVYPLLASAPPPAGATQGTKVVVRDSGDQSLWNRIVRQFGHSSPFDGSTDPAPKLGREPARP